jgi:hypothetical protein
MLPPKLSEEGPADDDEGEDGVPSYRELLLPAAELAGSWEVRILACCQPRRTRPCAKQAAVPLRTLFDPDPHRTRPDCALWRAPDVLQFASQKARWDACACAASQALHFDSALQSRLLRYAASALLFSDARVDPNLVAWNRCGPGCTPPDALSGHVI